MIKRLKKSETILLSETIKMPPAIKEQLAKDFWGENNRCTITSDGDGGSGGFAVDGIECSESIKIYGVKNKDGDYIVTEDVEEARKLISEQEPVINGIYTCIDKDDIKSN